jgi:hypothetical protein
MADARWHDLGAVEELKKHPCSLTGGRSSKGL